MRRRTGIAIGVMAAGLVALAACAAPTPSEPAEVPVVQADISTPTTESQAAPAADESAPADDSAPPPQPQGQPTAVPTRTPGGATDGSGSGSGPGTISGALRFPSEGHPAMRVYALRTDGQRWQFVNAQANQFNYTIQLDEPGDYYVIAYVSDGDEVKFVGGYSPNGKCVGDAGGDHSGCAMDDSSLLAVTVEAGQTYSGIDIVDWGSPEDYPSPPS